MILPSCYSIQDNVFGLRYRSKAELVIQLPPSGLAKSIVLTL
jgi:hypothetical protein